MQRIRRGESRDPGRHPRPLATRVAAAALPVMGAFLSPGCQSYQASPLDPVAHADHWRVRTPSSEEVRVFAERLAASTPDSVPFDPSDGLSLREGEVVALVFNPDLRIARLRAGVARATAEHAGRWDDPELGIDLLKITESVPDPWIVTPSLAITLPVSGRLAAEKARAEAAMAVALARVAEAEWRVQRDLREAWFTWSAQQLRLRQTEAILADLDSIIGSTSRLAEEGELPTTEATLFSIERETRHAALAQMRGDAAEVLHEVRSLLGLSPGAPVELVPVLAAGPTPPDGDEPGPANPTLARLRSEYEVSEQTLVREIRKQFPDVTIGPQAESDQGQSRIGLIGAIPIPILNSNRGGIAEARAERELARAAFETELERITGRLAAVRARRQGVHSRRTAVHESLVPLVDRQVTDARRLLDLGEGGSLVLLESLVRAHEAKLSLIDIQLADAQASNEIQFLLGPAQRKATIEDAPSTP